MELIHNRLHCPPLTQSEVIQVLFSVEFFLFLDHFMDSKPERRVLSS